jgi:hypothetical protein
LPSVTRALRLLASACCCISLCLCVGTGIASAEPKTGTDTEVVLSVAPIPTAADPSPGTPHVTWSTGNGSPGEVTVSSAGSKEALFASGPDGSASAPWISAGRSYVFRLYSIVSGHRLLARLKVGQEKAAAELVAVPQKPRITSPVVNRLLQLLAFGSITVLTLLAAMHVREVRRSG